MRPARPKHALRFDDAILQRDSSRDAVREAMRCHTAMGDQNSRNASTGGSSRIYVRRSMTSRRTDAKTRVAGRVVRPP